MRHSGSVTVTVLGLLAASVAGCTTQVDDVGGGGDT